MGIQQLVRQMPVLFAILNVGTAMSATTAGRMPINMAETQGMSMKWRKHMAMASMMRNEGSAVPNAVQRAPAVLRILYPMKTLMLMANTPGQLWAMASMSTNSSLLTHPLFSTTSASMRGIMA